jgi:adenine-specific DNA-methyltransferase
MKMPGSRTSLTDLVDELRTSTTEDLEDHRRATLGQYLTPAPVARLIASLVTTTEEHIRLLEPGAGTGSLVAATVEALCNRIDPPRSICVTAYEIDNQLIQPLSHTLELCGEECAAAGIEFDSRIIHADFIEAAAQQLRPVDFFAENSGERYNLVVTNPPYRKLNSQSHHRALLRVAGIETSNLYAAFLALSTLLLEDRGELVAITPRSFCNGTYFRPFRELLLNKLAIQHVHVFESRKAAFKEDSVLQENIIFRGVRGISPTRVVLTTGNGNRQQISTCRTIDYTRLVWPSDPNRVMHLVASEEGQAITDTIRQLPHRLRDLNLEVSTGRVVDFRAKEQLRQDPGPSTAPLIYPTHLASGRVVWPKPGKKPNAIYIDDYTRPQLVPNEVYVLVKRFSAKEERRRIVAVVYDGSQITAPEGVGFENHINYFHRGGRGIELSLARGLAAFLNSTLTDEFFRQFSGHTQVNAGDLRMLPYPSVTTLEELGAAIGDRSLGQDELDQLVNGYLGEGSL